MQIFHFCRVLQFFVKWMLEVTDKVKRRQRHPKIAMDVTKNCEKFPKL